MDSSVLATPTLKLLRVSSYEYSSSSGSSRNSGATTGCTVNHGSSIVETAPANRDLLYDQLCSMIAQEERDGYKCCDYLSYYSMRPSPSSEEKKSKSLKNIDEGCRTSICGWMYRVADHFSIDREGELVLCSVLSRLRWKQA